MRLKSTTLAVPSLNPSRASLQDDADDDDEFVSDEELRRRFDDEEVQRFLTLFATVRDQFSFL